VNGQRPGPLPGAPTLQAQVWKFPEGWFNVVKENLPVLKDTFAEVLLPPPSDSVVKNGYIPREWFNFNSAYGTEADLRSLLARLNQMGVVAIADVVVNHRGGTKDWADFTNPPLPQEAIVAEDEWGLGKGATDSGAGVPYARDLDHSNPHVQEAVKEYLKRLTDLGYTGLRFDFARGYGPKYVGEYLSSVGIAAENSVGEVWTNLDINNSDPHRQTTVDWIDGTGGASGAFDFTTKGLLQHAVATGDYGKLRDNKGKPSGVVGWHPARAWTFLDNHDTGSPPGGQDHWPFPGSKVEQGYAYLMTHPGTPMVFWPHFFDWGENTQQSIRDLISVREQAGVTSTSAVNIHAAHQGLYAAVVDGVSGQVAVRLGPAPWSPPEGGWTLAKSGEDFAVWTRLSDKASGAPLRAASMET
jgi:alpha-amylase